MFIRVSKSKRGSVLVFTLLIYLFSMKWTVWRISYFNTYNQSIKKISAIDSRINIEAYVIGHFRQFEDDLNTQIGEFTVYASKEGEKISVFVNGKMSYSFEYVIIEDESFILKTTEENYDFIK